MVCRGPGLLSTFTFLMGRRRSDRARMPSRAASSEPLRVARVELGMKRALVWLCVVSGIAGVGFGLSARREAAQARQMASEMWWEASRRDWENRDLRVAADLREADRRAKNWNERNCWAELEWLRCSTGRSICCN